MAKIDRKSRRKSHLLCPCCGHERAIENLGCDNCGARRVGDPLPRPDVMKPGLGPAFAASGCAAIIILAFAATWLLSNDLKVVRVLMVWAIGDGTELTREWLRLDPDLPLYRIFSYDAYRLAFFLSFGLIPLSLIGMRLARRALQLAQQDAARFGGLRLARVSMVLSTFLFLSFSAAAISSIPRTIERGRAERIATTKAALYHLHNALAQYYYDHGTNPSNFEELSSESKETLPKSDYWEHDITYTPNSVIATKGAAVQFSDYVLRSAGPDGIMGTADDIVMQNGVIVTATAETDLPTSLLVPEKPGK